MTPPVRLLPIAHINALCGHMDELTATSFGIRLSDGDGAPGLTLDRLTGQPLSKRVGSTARTVPRWPGHNGRLRPVSSGEAAALQSARTFQAARSGYLGGMARSRLPDTASVPIVLRISVTEDDVARIDQVLARPEFAEWSRSEWCLEIIRTALRYYMRASATAEAEPAPAVPEARAAPAPDPAPVPPPEPPLPDADELPPEPPDRPDCSHPQDARDYQTGTCVACGAILWD